MLLPHRVVSLEPPGEEPKGCLSLMLPALRSACLFPLAVTLLCLLGCEPPGDPMTGHLRGRTVPALDVVALDGVAPAPQVTGQLTLLNFWGTWCPPCRRELPGLVRLATRLAEEPRFQLIAVSCGGGGPDDLTSLRQETTAFLAAKNLALNTWADPSGQTRQAFADQLGFNAFPTSYLIGPDGRLLAVWRGYSPEVETEMAQAVAAALKQMPPWAPPTPTAD